MSILLKWIEGKCFIILKNPDKCPIATSSKSLTCSSLHFNKEYRNLFNTSHFKLINSTYFGQRDTLAYTLTRKPIHKAFVDILGRQNENVLLLYVYAMKIALSSFSTNFMNMWNNKNRFNKLFTNLLKTLLTVRLAPQRDAKLKKIQRKQAKEKNKKPQVTSQMCIRRDNKYLEKARADTENCDKLENMCQQLSNSNQYIRNKIRTKIEEGYQQRLETIAENDFNAEQQLLEMEDGSLDVTTDASRRRIRSLVSVMRNVIFQNHGKTMELQTCILICKFLMPYVPPKKD
ncbi:uncharacterized protein EV154DRAFT_484198 [Mucor mucedo]|uniref:uncharacterized protein n=1 Tax=Mucor mucedo TaxID=29922 RepID=UPI0022206EF2|nr:uncharacterized protein EV154DRAFT_484198 [Mucor mucedo]KAI7888339.1 hypothetical protein EV154DRAFT_484198 [Mucor mucedo]